MNLPSLDDDIDRRQAPLALVNAQGDVGHFLNLLTGLELQNSRYPELKAGSSQATRKALELAYGGGAPYFLVMLVWNGGRRTYVPYVSDAFEDRDEDGQRAVLRRLLNKGLALGTTGFQISGVGGPCDALRLVVAYLCEEVLTEFNAKLAGAG